MKDKGIFYQANGDKYEGEYKNGMRNGKEIFYLADENRYEGDYKDYKKNGKKVQETKVEE